MLKDHTSRAITDINSLGNSLEELQSASASCSSFFIKRPLVHLVSCETLPDFTIATGVYLYQWLSVIRGVLESLDALASRSTPAVGMYLKQYGLLLPVKVWQPYSSMPAI